MGFNTGSHGRVEGIGANECKRDCGGPSRGDALVEAGAQPRSGCSMMLGDRWGREAAGQKEESVMVLRHNHNETLEEARLFEATDTDLLDESSALKRTDGNNERLSKAPWPNGVPGPTSDGVSAVARPDKTLEVEGLELASENERQAKTLEVARLDETSETARLTKTLDAARLDKVSGVTGHDQTTDTLIPDTGSNAVRHAWSDEAGLQTVWPSVASEVARPGIVSGVTRSGEALHEGSIGNMSEPSNPNQAGEAMPGNALAKTRPAEASDVGRLDEALVKMTPDEALENALLGGSLVAARQRESSNVATLGSKSAVARTGDMLEEASSAKVSVAAQLDKSSKAAGLGDSFEVGGPDKTTKAAYLEEAQLLDGSSGATKPDEASAESKRDELAEAAWPDEAEAVRLDEACSVATRHVNTSGTAMQSKISEAARPEETLNGAPMAEESETTWPFKNSEAFLYEASGASQLDEASRAAKLDGASETAKPGSASDEAGPGQSFEAARSDEASKQLWLDKATEAVSLLEQLETPWLDEESEMTMPDEVSKGERMAEESEAAGTDAVMEAGFCEALMAARMDEVYKAARLDETSTSTRLCGASEVAWTAKTLAAASTGVTAETELLYEAMEALRLFNMPEAPWPHEGLEVTRPAEVLETPPLGDSSETARPERASEATKSDKLMEVAPPEKTSVVRQDEVWSKAVWPHQVLDAAKPAGPLEGTRKAEESAATWPDRTSAAWLYAMLEATRPDEASKAATSSKMARPSRASRQGEASGADWLDGATGTVLLMEKSEAPKPDEVSEAARPGEASDVTRLGKTFELTRPDKVGAQATCQGGAPVGARPGEASGVAWPRVESKAEKLVERLMAAGPDTSLGAARLDNASETAKQDESLVVTRKCAALEAARLDETSEAARPDGASETGRTDEVSAAPRQYGAWEAAWPDETSQAARLPEVARSYEALEAARPDGMSERVKRGELSAAVRHCKGSVEAKPNEESEAARPGKPNEESEAAMRDSEATKSPILDKPLEATWSGETSEAARLGEASEVARQDKGRLEMASSHEASGATRPNEASEAAQRGEWNALSEVTDQSEASIATKPGEASEAAWLGEALEVVLHDTGLLEKTQSIGDGGRRHSDEGGVAKGEAEYRNVGIRVSDGPGQVSKISGCDRLGTDTDAQDQRSCTNRDIRDTHRGDSEEITTQRVEKKWDCIMYSTLIRWLPRLSPCSLRVLSAPSSRVFMAFPKDGPGGDLTVQPSGNISLIGTAAALDYAVLLSLFCQLFLLNCNLLKSNFFGTLPKEQSVAFPPPHRQSRRIIASNRVLNNCITLNILNLSLQSNGTYYLTDSELSVEYFDIAQRHELLKCRMRNLLFLKNFGSTSLWSLHQLSHISFFVLGSPAHEGAWHE